MSVAFGRGYLRTRLELIRLRRAVRTAERVYRILEDKRDVLLSKLNELVEESQELRNRALSSLSESYRHLLSAYMELGPQRIKAITSTVPETVFINMNTFTMMGIPLVTLDASNEEAKIPYGLSDASVNLDEATRKMRDVIADICRASATENNIFRIANELRRTQRLINALEYIIIPRYMEAIRAISTALEENDRDYFVKLKHIKKILERRALG
ncbi:MAG: V-type ATP synthase subunit D [Nitrososphaerota archaeon]|nr:V-type ATP synthase subunit D [Candidatus Calditenuaceae archaeon]MDW8072845.1 V-type ATP synthase subunit D [Nitrososphaerota archaeon]